MPLLTDYGHTSINMENRQFNLLRQLNGQGDDSMVN